MTNRSNTKTTISRFLSKQFGSISASTLQRIKQPINLLVCNTDQDPEKERRYLDLLQNHRIDGLLEPVP